MKRTNSSISKASSYSEMGRYWDEHGIDECWDETSDVSFEFVAESLWIQENATDDERPLDVR